MSSSIYLINIYRSASSGLRFRRLYIPLKMSYIGLYFIVNYTAETID